MASLSNVIYVGSISKPMYKYDNAKIQLNSAKGIFSVDVLGNELAVDTFTATVRYNPDAPLAYSPSNATKAYVTVDQPEEEGAKVIYLVKKSADIGATYLHRAGWGTPVWWYVGGRVMAKGYMSKVERISRNMYRMTCMSGIGLLDSKMHFGGLYNQTQAHEIFASIIGNSFSYTVQRRENEEEEDVVDVYHTKVNGWLPYDTARTNLHRLLFALGASMTRKANGDYMIEYLSDTVIKVPAGRAALGGKVEYTVPIDGVEVTEHSFFTTSGDEEVTLYDTGSIYADNLTIVFNDAPVHDLRTTGTLTVVTSHVNYAVISGTGTLLGKKYTHTIRNVTVGGGTNNIKRVESNYLVSYANSYAIAERVYQYYTTAKRIEAKILLDWQSNGDTVAVNPGTRLSLRDGYGDPTTAYLASMDVLVTSVKGANCKLISGYVPSSGGNNFTHRVIITRNSTWTIPAGITFLRIVLVSGGTGGQGGYDGQPGQGGAPNLMTPDPEKSLLWFFDEDYQGERNSRYATWYWSRGQQPVAQGGAAGEPGSGGRIVITDINNVVPGSSCPCIIGAGGAGGERNGGAGAVGGDTQITINGTVYSTSAGLPDDNGFYDAFADITLAVPGESGHAGGNGGTVDITNDVGNNGTAGGNGGNVGTYKGGKGGAGKSWMQRVAKGWTIDASGGAGGGAAWGANGGAGQAPTSRNVVISGGVVWSGFFAGGKPGNGANASAPTKPTYGNGGGGGNGGGAGGNVSGIRGYHYYEVGFEPIGENEPWAQFSMGTGDNYAYAPEPKDRDCGGKGGLGSSGGDGGDGCIIIYY